MPLYALWPWGLCRPYLTAFWGLCHQQHPAGPLFEPLKIGPHNRMRKLPLAKTAASLVLALSEDRERERERERKRKDWDCHGGVAYHRQWQDLTCCSRRRRKGPFVQEQTNYAQEYRRGHGAKTLYLRSATRSRVWTMPSGCVHCFRHFGLWGRDLPYRVLSAP